MKFFFSLIIIVFTLFSCSKEDPKSSEKTISEFTINSIKGTIDESGKKITVALPYGTDVKTLSPAIKISDKAKVSPASGVSQNFTQPIAYTVTAEDGSTIIYNVTVNIAKNNEAKITAFSFANPIVQGSINEIDKTISLSILPGTGLNALVPFITCSDGATISPKTGIAQDFTNPIIYTVTSEKGDEVKYTVKVSVDQSNKRLISFVLSALNPIVTATIDEERKTISAIVPYGTDLKTLSPVITISTGATISPATGVIQNFTDPVSYGNTSTQTYLIR